MNKESKLLLMKNRLATLQNKGDKNVKSGGCVRKLNRQIRNLQNK